MASQSLQIQLFSKSEQERLKRTLIAAGIGISAERYLRLVILLAVILGLSAAVAAVLYGESITMAAAAAVIVFGVTYVAGRRFPALSAKARAERIESDLPIAIRSIAIQLNMRLPFEIALENVASWGFQCSSEFARALDEIAHGASIPEAIQAIGARVDSTIVKRVMAQLVRAYEEGTGGDVLKKLADELIAVQKLRLRAFGAQVSFLGLVFIALACIAPTLYLVYAMITSLYLGSKIDPAEIWFMFLVVFPAIVTAIIVYISLRTPRAITGGSEPFLSGKERSLLHSELEKLGIVMPLEKVFLYSIVLSAVASLALLIAFPASVPYNFIALFLPLFGYFVLLYMIEARAKELEEYLPDALFQVAAFEKGVPIERMIRNIARSGYRALSEEFAMASRQIAAGASVSKALFAISRRTASKLLERAIILLNQCYRTGRDTQVAVRETAEDIFEMLMLAKEQTAMLAMQRYTILIGGCILIPIILAFVISIISSLGYQPGAGLSKITEAERQAIISASTDAIQWYLIIYVLLASIFISHQEGKARKFIIYFLIFATIALAIFNVVKAQIRISA